MLMFCLRKDFDMIIINKYKNKAFIVGEKERLLKLLCAYL